jgi:hypothetical protein
MRARRVSALLASVGLVDAYWFTEAARDRGRIVHSIGESIFRGEAAMVAPVWQGWADAILDGVRALDLQSIAVERRLWSGTVTGRPDVVGWLPRSVGKIPAGPVIVDLKSGAAFPAHGVQLAMYERLADGTAGLREALPDAAQRLPWARVGLYVTEDGAHRFKHYTDPADRATALAIIQIAAWRDAHGIDDGTPGDDLSDDPQVQGGGLGAPPDGGSDRDHLRG